MSESAYPYTGRDGTCKYAATGTGVKSTGFVNVTAGNTSAMKTALASRPLSVCVDAESSFQNYKTGIYAGTDCSTTNINHATNVVGWGTASGVDYWIMRNSWGTTWGESGYMRVKIVEGNGVCAIHRYPSYPITN